MTVRCNICGWSSTSRELADEHDCDPPEVEECHACDGAGESGDGLVQCWNCGGTGIEP